MLRLGRYEVGRVLGEGGEGRVHEATLIGPGSLRKPVALKILHHGSESLRREARIGGLLRHRNLVDVYEIGEQDGTWFCALERCAGSLAEHVPLPPRAVVEVGLAVCDALQYAHEDLGLVHLDLKPENLLLSDDGTVKVADLGIARADGFEHDDRIRGTPGFMAPEQARGETVGPRSDVYALARTLLKLAEGHGGAPATLDWASDPGLPSSAPPADVSWLDPVLEPCLSLGPEHRPEMAELAEALRALDVGGPGLREHLGLTGGAAALVRRPDTNLGGEPDPFVGREGELARLAAALDQPGLLTLKGPAGVGKTRLGVAAARQWREAHRGQVWFCELAEARSFDELLYAVASTLGVPLGKHEPAVQLGRAIAGRGAAVFVLDNFEQLVEHAAVVEQWREQAPQGRFLVTSRVPLGLQAERVVELDVLTAADAQALLVVRARARGLEVASDPDLPELAARLDALPLALELAAGRLGVLSVRDLLDRLELKLLRRGTDDRHGTLQAALDWSWDLLDPVGQDGLPQLSVFAGGFTVEAAEAVLELPDGSVLDLLDRLVEQSWISARGGRLTMLESVRAYAAARLHDGGAAEVRHGAWASCVGRDGAVRGSAGWLSALAIELDNLVVACRRAVERRDHAVAVDTVELAQEVLDMTGPVEATVALATAVAEMDQPPDARTRSARILGHALWRAGRHDEAFESTEVALSVARELGDLRKQGTALGDLGLLHHDVGRMREARTHYEAAIAAYRACGQRDTAARMLGNLGIVHRQQGRMDEARACYEEALAIHREMGNRRSEGHALGNLGNLWILQGQLDEALVCCQAALRIHREVGNRRAEGMALGNLGSVYLNQGRMDEARTHFEAAMSVSREVGDRRGEGLMLGNLASVQADLHRLDEARALFEAALAVHREVGNRRSEGIALANLGEIHAEQGRLAEARASLEAALAIHREVGNRRSEARALSSLGRLTDST